MLTIRAECPDKLLFLTQARHRYKILYGGRGGAKSWGIARALLILGVQCKLRILCARETMRSIAESVHHLLETQIDQLGMRGMYDVQKATILGCNGTEFVFAGLRLNIANIKSTEDIDIVWVEEAQSVSRHSWQTLIPTIRKDGSEIWASFNPELETDDTYQRFVLHPPPDARVVRINWSDNPWFPDVLRREMEHLQATDYDAYMHVWEGQCVRNVEGAVYAKELREIEAGGRITRVPYDASKPVHTFWDLGFGDSTAIWCAQAVGFEYRLIDYIEASRESLAHYLRELQTRPYVWGTDYLPHDAQSRQLGSGRSIEELMRAAGRRVQIVPKLSVADGLNAVRTILPQCWFDADKCADGLQALRHYRYGIVQTLGSPTREPLHDWASHGADAFRYFAVGIRAPKPAPPPQQRPQQRISAWS